MCPPAWICVGGHRLFQSTQSVSIEISSSLPGIPPLADLSQLQTQNQRWLRNIVTSISTTKSKKTLDVFEGTNVDMEHLQRLANRTPTPLRLQDMYKYGRGIDKAQRIRNSLFLHQELPIRLAQRAHDLLTLPYGLSDAEPIRQVAQTYINYLHTLESLPAPENAELEDQFTNYVQSMILDRSKVPASIFQGIQGWMQENDQAKTIHLKEMEEALYRFFTARVGLRFLAEHHVLSCSRESCRALGSSTFMFSPEKEFLGCIQTTIDPVKEVEKVAKLVQDQTLELYGLCPEIQVVGSIIDKHRDTDFTYSPHHLHYMVSELVKNSCRATVYKYQWQLRDDPLAAKLDKVKVVIVKGAEDVTIKVADRGGGIPRSKMERIWKFAHSTADESEGTSDFAKESATGAQIRGFGLPLARIYARYFGGELTLKSMEGYGLDAYLHLSRLGDACENLPKRVRRSPGQRDSTPSHGTRHFSTKV